MICYHCKNNTHYKCSSLKCRCDYECNKGIIVEEKRSQKIVFKKATIERAVSATDVARAAQSLKQLGLGGKFVVTNYSAQRQQRPQPSLS